MASTGRSEDVLGERWDHCVSDTLIKMGAGFTLGAVFSLVLFKRRKWPLILGTGAGLGIGMANCQNSLNNAFKALHTSSISNVKQHTGSHN